MSRLNQQIARMSPLKLAFAAQKLRERNQLLTAEPVAIIGLGCRFPGAESPEEFWTLLREGREGIREVPPSRWDIDAYYDPDPDAPGKMYTRHGGFLRQVDGFDAGFFGITPREARGLDPQQRLLLEVGWEALEHAGISPARLFGSATGVFVGIGNSEYAQRILRTGDPAKIDAYLSTGNALSVAAGRLAYTLGLGGPCMALDTACSSALVAIHLACQSLRAGESTLALAGGVNLLLAPEITINFCRARMLAVDGRCKTFDVAADGYVRGEGCGLVVLKRLSDAVADGDRVLALIRGTAINQDGASGGITVPSGPAQVEVIRSALAAGGVEPEQIDFVEAHGTGTSLGDPIEIAALAEVFGASHSRARPLRVGAVKTNIGHLETAAGIAGLIKLVLALEHQAMPPSLHLREPNPRIDWAGIPVEVNASLREWPAGRRLAGVSSFGFSGTNAHVVIEEAPSLPRAPREAPEQPVHVLVLSATDDEPLRNLADSLADHVAAAPELPVADLCFSLATGRAHLSRRAALVVGADADGPSLATSLRALAAGRTPEDAVLGETEVPAKIAFLFTGQGSQYPDMGRELYEGEPVVREVLDRCEAVWRELVDGSLLAALFRDEPPLDGASEPLDRTGLAQPALFAIEVALATALQRWGVEPAFVMGHSVGELAAACVAGVFSVEDGLRLVAARARSMDGLPAGGTMTALAAGEARVREQIAALDLGDAVAIAAVNGPDSVVISGQREAVERVASVLAAEGIRTDPLAVSHAFHSPLMAPMLGEFAAAAAAIPLATPRIGLVSNLDGALLLRPTAEHWVRHVREPVRFAAGIDELVRRGCNVFVELGPKPTLSGLGRLCAPEPSLTWVPTLRRGQSAWDGVARALAALHVRGVAIDWAAVDAGRPRARLSLPRYPFQRRRHWLDFGDDAGPSRGDAGPPALHPLAQRKLASPVVDALVFESDLSTARLPYLDDHRIHGMVVVPSAGHVAMLIASAALLTGDPRCSASKLSFPQALVLPELEPRTAQLVLTPEADEHAIELISISGDELDPTPHAVHATGRLRAAAPPAVAPVSLDELRERCPEPLSGPDFYATMNRHHATLGPRFQVIDALSRGAGELVADLRLPDGLDDLDLYAVHPVLLDACFQILGGMIPAGGDATYVPFGIEAVRVHAVPEGRRFVCHIRQREPARAGDRPDARGAVVLDVELLSTSGRRLVVLEGLEYQRASAEALVRALQPELGQALFVPEWIEVGAPAREATLETVLVLAEAGDARSEGSLAEALIARLRATGARVIVARPGDARPEHDGDEQLVDPADGPAFVDLVRRLAASGLDAVVDLWALAAPAIDWRADDLGPALEQAERLGPIAALHLVQGLVAASLVRAPRLVLVTEGARAGDPRRPELGCAWGLAQVIDIEHRELGCRLVDVDPSAELDARVEALMTELQARDDERQISYRHGVREVARLRTLERARASEPAVIRSDRSYLITGGLGGLGCELLRWLSERGARHLIAVARSAPSEAATAVLDSLRGRGVELRVERADVCDRVALAAILGRIEPPLAGVVHAAGVLDDGAIAKFDAARMRRVLAPKLLGLANLHALTRDLPLDLFVSFASTTGLFGGPGQASYAAANSFMDAFAAYRRSLGLPAVTIDWGPWATRGMAEPEGMTSSSAWLRPLPPEFALAALDSILADDRARTAVFLPRWSALRVRLGDRPAPPLIADLLVRRSTAGARSSATTGPTRELWHALLDAAPELRPRLLDQHLRRLIEAVLGIASAELEPRQRLFDLGADSLMAVELRARLEASLGRSLRSTLIFDFPTLEALNRHLLAELDDELARATGLAASMPDSSSDEDELDDLSEHELAAMLSSRLASLKGG